MVYLAVEAIQSGKWTSRHGNWRNLLAPERPEKLNTTSQPVSALATTTMLLATITMLLLQVVSTSSPVLPLFDMVCQLLYKQCPHELVSHAHIDHTRLLTPPTITQSHFVKFAQLAHDYQPPPSDSEGEGDQEYDFFRKCRKVPSLLSPSLLSLSHLTGVLPGEGCQYVTSTPPTLSS